MRPGRDELGLKRTWGEGGGVGERSGSSRRALRALEALGCSYIRILRVWRRSGGVGCPTDLSHPKRPGFAKEDPHACGVGGGGWGDGVGWEIHETRCVYVYVCLCM